MSGRPAHDDRTQLSSGRALYPECMIATTVTGIRFLLVGTAIAMIPCAAAAQAARSQFPYSRFLQSGVEFLTPLLNATMPVCLAWLRADENTSPFEVWPQWAQLHNVPDSDRSRIKSSSFTLNPIAACEGDPASEPIPGLFRQARLQSTREPAAVLWLRDPTVVSDTLAHATLYFIAPTHTGAWLCLARQESAVWQAPRCESQTGNAYDYLHAPVDSIRRRRQHPPQSPPNDSREPTGGQSARRLSPVLATRQLTVKR